MQARAKANNFCPACDLSNQMMTVAATRPMPVNSQRCQPSELARNENAAPLLCTRTTLKKLVTTVLSPKR
ncbi:hypothetical protein GALL_491780 [mine drainage metagenome]|uniref:Uncharacterized protein n=1 Tax=mine drainage metagenome TaxID=410659 RepID=A0A1J5PEL1_9ZZZZ